MIARIIEFSIRWRFLVIFTSALVALWGIYCAYHTPVDAIPDLSENQVMVWADWEGRSPRDVEDQVTYPLSVSLQGLAGVKAIRAASDFGFSMITVVFDDDADFYFARQRVAEKLSAAVGVLPEGVSPQLGSDATVLGQILWYTVEGEDKSLDELRAIQDWYVRYQLFVPGVAEVATVGGFVREYQVDVDPQKLRAFDVGLEEVFEAVMRSNASVGGKVMQKGGSEYLIRAVGWIRGIEDLRQTVVSQRYGIPLTLEQVGNVRLGPAFRRGMLEKNGSEAVGGVVVMRQGERPLEVIERVKAKIQSLGDGLPRGVRVVPFYDRTGLIHASIETLTATLIEATVIAGLVVILVLGHARSALVICMTLPLAVLISFILMYYLGVPSNIMSLSGIAISIGVLVDAGIVMTENAYNRLQEKFAGGEVRGDTREAVLGACQVVGGPLFFSIVIMLLSFAPLFFLGGLEGKMFTPLACTKSFALVGVAALAITLVPALIPTFVRGRLKSQREVWIVRSCANVYEKILEIFFRNPDAIVVITGLFLVVGLPVFPRKMPWILFVAGAPFFLGYTILKISRRKLACFAILALAAFLSFLCISPRGEEFMPPLDELSLLDMPVTRPSINITQATLDLKHRNAVLRGFPEVHQVVGKLGRAETPTDPAPIDMVETVATLQPKGQWPRRKIPIETVRAETGAAARRLEELGILGASKENGARDGGDAVAFEAQARADRLLRALCMQRIEEEAPSMARKLLHSLRGKVISFLDRKGVLQKELPEDRWTSFEDSQVQRLARRLNELILLEDVTQASREVADFLVQSGALAAASDTWAEEPGLLDRLGGLAAVFTGRTRKTVFEDFTAALESEKRALAENWVDSLDGELESFAPRALAQNAMDAVVQIARAQKRLAREPRDEELSQALSARLGSLGSRLFLERKRKSDLVAEMDADLQVPGWSNIWTQPIINRIDMLSTGVRTEVGVKIFGRSLDDIVAVSRRIVEVLKTVPGAADVTADQIVGENYLEITVDRQRAARYGLGVEDVENVVEIALGGKQITTTVEGRERFPVRVRYPREYLADEEKVKSILVPAKGSAAMASHAFGETRRRITGAPEELGMPGESGHFNPIVKPPTAVAATAKSGPGGKGAEGTPPPIGSMAQAAAEPRLLQVPLAMVADVRVVTGPSMIKSENGMLRTFVSLNVRGRDIVGFVEEARRTVSEQVVLPSACSIEWSGQFEHQVRAQNTLMIVVPLVVCIIFAILYLTYRDFADTLMMFLAVPGAIAGGAIFQFLLPMLGVDVSGNFSVAVWVGYIACFGLATETSIVMLVYLREAIAKRGGIENLRSEEEIKEAVIEGAVHRLRPKLLTEATTLLALIPMLWATGVGSEYMRPMVAPILGGILVADEVVDILIPVLFYRDRCRRLRNRRAAEGSPAP